MKRISRFIVVPLMLLMASCLMGCSYKQGDTLATPEDVKPDSSLSQNSIGEANIPTGDRVGDHITPSNLIRDIVEHPAFRGYGEKLLPSVGDQNNFDITLSAAARGSDENIENITASLNHLVDDAAAGLTIYYDFYSEQERKDDPAKDATGLFFYRGEPGAPFAVIAPGGAFAFVGSFQAGFPYAKEISDAGYNAFLLKYRVGGEQIATEDLAAAISFIFENAEELGVSTEDYSVWGSSAGGRMAANIGTEGPVGYGGDDLPRPSAVIMCCTGHSRYSENDPPTFVVVGENDGIASPATMERRVNALKSVGVETEFHVYPGLGHYFGLGIGTVAEGWMDNAIAFWERYMDALGEDTVQTAPGTHSKNIQMILGDTVVTAELNDSEIAQQFIDLLPQTISMSRGRDREYYGRIDGTLSYDEKDIRTIAEDGDLAYWFSGNSLAFFFNMENDSAVNSAIVVFGKITSDLSVFDDMSGSETVTVTLLE